MKQRRFLGGVAALSILSVAAIGALILGVSLIAGNEAPKPLPIVVNDPTPLVKVGSRTITRYQLDVARQYTHVRNLKHPDYGILLDLITCAAHEQILESYGRPVTPLIVEEEAARIERSSKDRETLGKVRRTLNAHPGMYELIYIRPSLANRLIYKFHDADPGVQAEVKAKAEEGLKLAIRDPDAFRRLKDEFPEQYRRIDSREPPEHPKVPEGQSIPPEELKRAKEEAFTFVNTNLNRVSPGEVRPEVIDEKGAYLVARLVERTEDFVVFETLSYFKKSFEPWFESELKKLKIEILDKGFAEDYRRELKDHMYGRWMFGDQP